VSKTNASFKLSKPTKTMMATIVDPVLRAQYKNIMIDAEVAAGQRPKSSKQDRETSK
jgi:hypothetical protein